MSGQDHIAIQAAKAVLGELEPETTPITVSSVVEDDPTTAPISVTEAVQELPAVQIPTKETGVIGSLVPSEGLQRDVQTHVQHEAHVVLPQAPTGNQNITVFHKFGDIPDMLRTADGVDIHEIKRLNLAATLEALNRASTAHENFPSPDAGFAVANLSEQVLKLTKDLEKSQDPRALHEQIMHEVMGKLTHEMVVALATEMKKCREEVSSMIVPEKSAAFDLAFKIAVSRMGPAMKELLETARIRLSRSLNIKNFQDKPDA